MVKKGAETFHTWACSECHTVVPNDPSIKSGPTRYNLFLREARMRDVKLANGETQQVKADKNYLHQCVREPAAILAIAEYGATKGQPYPAVMPQYRKEMVTDEAVEAIWHYLRTCCEEGQRGPVQVMGEWKGDKGKPFYEKSSHLLVGSHTLIQRVPVFGGSGRAIHVALKNGVNYTFDPRFLSLRGVWGGGFLDLANEQNGRSKPGSARPAEANEMRDASPMLVPLTSSGKRVDFAFKEPDWNDDDTIIHHLEKGGDFLKELASWDVDFLG